MPLILNSCFCLQIQILEDLDEQMYIITLEEEAIQRKLNGMYAIPVMVLLQMQYLERFWSGVSLLVRLFSQNRKFQYLHV